MLTASITLDKESKYLHNLYKTITGNTCYSKRPGDALKDILAHLEKETDGPDVTKYIIPDGHVGLAKCTPDIQLVYLEGQEVRFKKEWLYNAQKYSYCLASSGVSKGIILESFKVMERKDYIALSNSDIDL